MHKILVVDDDVDLSNMVKLFLQKNNFTAKVLHKWEEIPLLVNLFNPDLILLDITLTGADGRVICKQLKTAEESKDIPVLLFSAKYNMEETFSEFLADGFISKPFNPQTLINEINLIMAGKVRTS